MRPTAPVTMILPNYNHAEEVERAIAGVLHQTLRAAHLIVVDDGSSDKSLAHIEIAVAGHPNVTVLENGRNRGVEFSVARALAHTTTPFICAISASDQLSPGFLEALSPWLESHPTAGLYLSDFAFRLKGRARVYPKHIRLASEPGFLSPQRVELRLARSGFILPAYGCVFRLEALAEAGGFQPSLRWHADWFAELVMAFRHGVCYVPRVLATAELDAEGYSSGARHDQAQSEVLDALLEQLQRAEYRDVRDAFLRSGALAYFGWHMARAAARRADRRDLLPELPWRWIALQEVKRRIVEWGPERLRELYWSWRFRLQERFARS